MLNIQKTIKDINIAFKTVGNFHNSFRLKAEGVTYNASRKFWSRLGQQMKKLPQGKASAKHNTPIHLSSQWKSFVPMPTKADEQNPRYKFAFLTVGGLNPIVVDQSTKPHFEKNHPFYSKVKHPGTSGKHFVQKAINNFNATDVKTIKNEMDIVFDMNLSRGKGLVITSKVP